MAWSLFAGRPEPSRPLALPGVNRDTAPSTPISPGMLARVTGQARSWLGMNEISGSPQLPFFPPGDPGAAAAQGAQGRRMDYANGHNITARPRGAEPITFELLRAISDPTLGGYDLLRLAIETRKDQMSQLIWSVMPRKQPNQPGRPKSDDRCQQMEVLFRHPDRATPWGQWVTQLLEEHLVIDAPTIYRRRDMGGRTIGLELIDGALIQPLLNYDGRRPETGPAYKQILKGVDAVHYTRDELIYMPRNPRVHKIYGMCYTPDHEVLTRRGWLPFTQVTLDDEIATRSPVGAMFEWQRPTRIVTMPHRGEVYRFHSRSVDLLVTPDHQMLLDSLPARCGGRVRGRGGDVLARAEDIARGHNRMNKIPMTSTWEGVEVGARVFAMAQPEGTIEVERRVANGSLQRYTRLRHRGNERPVTISGDDYCALMGAYLAEGNLRAQGGIEIAQRDMSKGYGAYASLLARVSDGPAQHNGKAFILPRRGLTEHFRAFGHAHEKYVPDEIMNAPPRQLRLFWDYFMLGDGCFAKRPSRSGRGGHAGQPTHSLTTVSRRLADQMVEIAQKLGWSACVSSKPAGQAVIMGRSCPTRERHCVRVRRSAAMSFTVTKSFHDGLVHCVTVPNGVIYVRRNGKPAWCGNSPVEQVLVTVNIGLRRQAGQLAFYTEGNVPDAIMQVPPEWSVAQIAEYQDHWDSMLADAIAGNRRKVKFVPNGAVLQMTRNEGALVDQFDEWLARVIAYCFSLPPTPFVRQNNRATAETAYETSLSEGLAPMMGWMKGIMDYILAHWLDCPDLEFIWDNIKKTDPAEKETRDLALTQRGVISSDDMRVDRGLEPQGVPCIVYGVGPAGFMSVETIKKIIANGWDLTGVPQPGMGVPGAPGGDLSTIPGGADLTQLGTGAQGDPLAGLPPEILTALGLPPPAPPAAGQGVPGQGAPGQGASDPNAPALADPNPPEGAAPPVNEVPSPFASPDAPRNAAANVVPIHRHPEVRDAFQRGDRMAHHMAARVRARRNGS